MEHLIEKGANVNTTNEHGDTLLDLNDRLVPEIAELLRKNGGKHKEELLKQVRTIFTVTNHRCTSFFVSTSNMFQNAIITLINLLFQILSCFISSDSVSPN